MAHEIEEHDNVILHEKPAWHGLGIVVKDAATPVEALIKTDSDYEVQPWALTAHGPDGQTMALSSHVLNVRADIEHPYGVVTDNYQIIQPMEMAKFCEALAEEGDQVKIESMGTIRNGAKMWFLLKGESFSVREDENIPYICVSNGHDGLSGFRCTPTTIRVVCSNTLHMVIPRFESGAITNIKQAGFSFRHVGNVMERVEEAKRALNVYNKGLKDTREVIDAVAAKDIKSREDVQKFFLECYTNDFGAIASEPKDEKEAKKRVKAMDACNKMGMRFDQEQIMVGANYWAAINAYTGWVQNDKMPRTKNVEVAREQKMHSKLFGTDANRAHHALQVALAS